ncbi:MAG TPA: hypothetical protein VG897_14680, partial [Terriglobales bacterium]|nr:hypothetical protein [Terriglobales bacterium]
MKVLHVLETSIPNTVGYTIRANEILTHQRRIGIDALVVTSPFFATTNKSVRKEQIEGITYYRTNFIRTPDPAEPKIL